MASVIFFLIFFTDMTGIKVVLLVYFIVTKTLTLTFYFYQIFERRLAKLLSVKP